MTTDRCDRMWQVEALDDGRLELEDQASFARHSQACAVCSAERVRLNELRRILSEAPTAERTELERRRARIALLGAANQRVIERRTPSRRVQTWALVAALPLLVLSTFALARSVLVTEGVVAPRVDGAEHVLRSGERWQRGSETASASPVATPESQPLESVAAPTQAAVVPTDSERGPANGNPAAASSVVTSPRPTPARLVPSASASHPSVAAAEAPARDDDQPTGVVGPTAGSAGSRFAEAVAAFGAGDYGRADTLFGAFARDFPTDSRAEDASFLRADARARRGDKAGAAAAARAYLRAYPNGLRRPAAERLVEDR